MDTEQAVQSSIGLLQRISENPRAVLELLDPAERDRLMTQLSELAEWSAGVKDEADLLYVTDTLHRLLMLRNSEATSAQEQPTTRKVTIEYAREAYGEEHGEEYDKRLYIQEHAAQIHNHVVRCRETLERVLLNPPGGHGDDT